jgi:hypothetical protein
MTLQVKSIHFISSYVHDVGNPSDPRRIDGEALFQVGYTGKEQLEHRRKIWRAEPAQKK